MKYKALAKAYDQYHSIDEWDILQIDNINSNSHYMLCYFTILETNCKKQKSKWWAVNSDFFVHFCEKITE